MRAFDILNKLKWTNQLDRAEIVILHRGAPDDRKTISGKEIVELGRDRFLTKDSCIPLHRVLEVRLEGKILWRRHKQE
ncbi:MAG: DUF504 domain-containing protein [Candidatus Aenigmatarchaeota archaeon]|nr:MAG: DUF504 domain-containing protein [Candidatus Aenigmarchaeota archaeon]